MIILLFGQIAEIAGTDHLEISSVTDTEELQNFMHKEYPALTELKYIVAVDKRIIKQNTLLTNQNTVALMPPFSGG